MTIRSITSYLTVSLCLAPVAGLAQLSDQNLRERANALLRQMTVEEKAGQLNQASGVTVANAIKEVSDDAIVKGQVGSILWQVDVKEINRLQHVAVVRSRLHIPLLVGFDVTGQMLAELGIEFLGRTGIGEWCTESRVVVGLCHSGNDIDAQRLVIHLGHRDEHRAAGEKRHEFNENRTSSLWRVRVLSLARADYVVCWEDGLTRLGADA